MILLETWLSKNGFKLAFSILSFLPLPPRWKPKVCKPPLGFNLNHLSYFFSLFLELWNYKIKMWPLLEFLSANIKTRIVKSITKHWIHEEGGWEGGWQLPVSAPPGWAQPTKFLTSEYFPYFPWNPSKKLISRRAGASGCGVSNVNPLYTGFYLESPVF